MRFPVFASGGAPFPGAPDALGGPVRCGGGEATPGDIVVADEEGIVVVPAARARHRTGHAVSEVVRPPSARPFALVGLPPAVGRRPRSACLQRGGLSKALRC